MKPLFALLLTATSAAAGAAPRLDGVLTDHGVIQRGQPVDLSGDAAPGETVMVTLAGHSVTARADRNPDPDPRTCTHAARRQTRWHPWPHVRHRAKRGCAPHP